VDVKMGHPIAKHECVDVFCSLAGLEGPAEARGHQAQGTCFYIGEACQPWDVSFGFKHETTQVSAGLPVADLGVPHVDQIILVDSATWDRDLSAMFAADEAIWFVMRRNDPSVAKTPQGC
jgi:hypothetical protein